MRQNLTFPGLSITPDQPQYGSEPHTNTPTPAARKLQAAVDRDVWTSLSLSAQKSYKAAWNQYSSFMTNHLNTTTAKATSRHLAMYVAHLHQQHLKASSIKTRLSAIGFISEMMYQQNPTKSFTIQKLLLSYQKKDKKPRTRNPITLHILKRILRSISKSKAERYSRYLYSSLYTSMYHAALRVSEVCHMPLSDHTLQIHQIQHSAKSMSIKFSSYKHNANPEASLILQPDHSSTCPVTNLGKYRTVRGSAPGPAFCHKNGSPLTRTEVTANLHHHLTMVGYKKLDFNTHSLRIGKTTDLAINGYSHSKIAMIGRWKSNAFLKYIKPTKIHAY